MTGDGGSCKAKRRRETATDTGKVLFSIDGGAWDSHDDDEDGREGADNDREDYDLEQIKKCTWDAKFRGVTKTHTPCWIIVLYVLKCPVVLVRRAYG